MNTKVIPAQKALVKTVRTTLRNIVDGIGNWPDKIMGEASSSGLRIAGAFVYIYKGCDDKIDTEFELQMCLPVVDYSTYQGTLETKVIPEFKCVEKLYVGSMPDLATKGWGAFMGEAALSKPTFTQEGRETYLKWVGFQSQENQVLLQMGIE